MENLNAEQVKKALECCTRGRESRGDIPCLDCPYNEFYLAGRTGERQVKGTCQGWLMKYALVLIKELTEEVAEEKAIDEMCAEVIRRQDKEIAQKDAKIKRLRADTIDEFVYMVKEKMREVATGKRTSLIGTGWIDEIARELKGE